MTVTRGKHKDRLSCTRARHDPARNDLLSNESPDPIARQGTLIQADAVRFFRKSPAREPAPHRVHYPWNPPEAELPGIVPIDTLHFDRSEQAAIAIIGMSAYTRGYEFFLARRIRPGTPGIDEDPTPDALRRGLTEAQSFQISLQFSDGRKAINGRPRGDSEPAGPILQPRGGGGTSHSQLLRWWAWPLPPSGPLEFICQWPIYGIGETRVGIDAQLILDAARRSVQLWPEDEG